MVSLDIPLVRVCRYKPFIMVEAQDGSSEDAEAQLRAYFSGSNSSQSQIEWPTPLYRASSGKLAAILPGFQVRP